MLISSRIDIRCSGLIPCGLGDSIWRGMSRMGTIHVVSAAVIRVTGTACCARRLGIWLTRTRERVPSPSIPSWWHRITNHSLPRGASRSCHPNRLRCLHGHTAGALTHRTRGGVEVIVILDEAITLGACVRVGSGLNCVQRSGSHCRNEERHHYPGADDAGQQDQHDGVHQYILSDPPVEGVAGIAQDTQTQFETSLKRKAIVSAHRLTHLTRGSHMLLRESATNMILVWISIVVE